MVLLLALLLLPRVVHTKQRERRSNEKKKRRREQQWEAVPILPPCASSLNDLYCMVNAPQKVVDICNGTKISFGTNDLAFNVDYYLPIADEVKINCPTKDCIVERRTFTTTENCYPEDIGCGYHYFRCPFFTVDLNSHVTFEGLRF